MAPEYLDDGVITMKTDIYSLGVIIRHMVKGRNSADTTDEEVLANWLIRLEKDPSQMMRQQTTRLLFETEYKEQIKACMDISWRCTLRKPMDRPTTQHILLTLEETEAKIKSVVGPTPPNAGQIAKFGPWGGDGGKTRDIRMTPCHLHSVTISSGTIIDSIGFSFTDHYGQHHTTGPWGGKEGTNKARVARIGRPLGGDEGVLHGITDLSGQQRSRGGGPSGECGDSDDEPNGDFAKFGPWGGDGGQPQDIGTLPCRLDRIKISSGLIIDSIEFSYAGPDSQYRTAGPWGGHGGDNSSFQLAGSEFLTGVSGSIGTFNGHANVITSLTFVTNARSYGPFGRGRGTSFHIPVQGNGCIVGFFGRSGRYLNAIGVYTAPKPEPKAVGKQDGGDEAVVARIGPWGGVGNALHDIAERPHRLHRVTIFSGTIVNSLEYLYSDGDGQQHTTGPWGGCGGTGRKIHLAPEEFIVEVTGTFHPCAWDRTIPSVVSSLTLVTSTGKTHGPFGTQLGAAFQVPVQSDSRIVGFFAHGDNYIEAIGAYVKKLTESSNR
ncbi:OSJNBa0016N04.16-like protein [Zea mays]|uniref:OSJNBa0016N04.16-like protein n=2 Tax=Zea mays TaxID=4577 RepID=A0A1D6PQT8_MAIZE|nr:OSJNBa0016N04.16-like protein [Zea mays]